jgi:hypothetical protein
MLAPSSDLDRTCRCIEVRSSRPSTSPSPTRVLPEGRLRAYVKRKAPLVRLAVRVPPEPCPGASGTLSGSPERCPGAHRNRVRVAPERCPSAPGKRTLPFGAASAPAPNSLPSGPTPKGTSAASHSHRFTDRFPVRRAPMRGSTNGSRSSTRSARGARANASSRSRSSGGGSHERPRTPARRGSPSRSAGRSCRVRRRDGPRAPHHRPGGPRRSVPPTMWTSSSSSHPRPPTTDSGASFGRSASGKTRALGRPFADGSWRPSGST